jgi:hypothetical protein
MNTATSHVNTQVGQIGQNQPTDTVAGGAGVGGS